MKACCFPHYAFIVMLLHYNFIHEHHWERYFNDFINEYCPVLSRPNELCFSLFCLYKENCFACMYHMTFFFFFCAETNPVFKLLICVAVLLYQR
uniref:Uncharacterized protein n=1 Tax=Rhipicephalus appendiculatus TaxID=34631 RepID=A0A131YFX0_RHIAP